MEKKDFGTAMGIYLTNFKFDLDTTYTSLMYNLLKKENITLESFKRGVYGVIKINHEEYFEKYKGKPLTFADWLQACGQRKQTENDVISAAKRVFLEKLDDRITGFQPEYSKKEFNDSLTENESRAVQRMGGSSDCWTRVNREDGYNTSKAKLLKEAGDMFESVYNEDKNGLMIENNKLGGQSQKLVQSFVKKLNEPSKQED